MAELSPRTTRLNVNIDHVATVRQARRAIYPSPLEAARLAEAAGAHGITVHLRGDRRHIQDADVESLITAVHGKLNLEMAATSEMVAIAARLRPTQVTLVAERDQEVTTEGGLEVSRIPTGTLEKMRRAGLSVALFVDPAPATVTACLDLFRAGEIEAIELNTDAYARCPQGAAAGELDRLAAAASRAADGGLAVYAGHALTTANVGPVAALRAIEELNIGHALIGRAVMVGIETATREFLAAMARA